MQRKYGIEAYRISGAQEDEQSTEAAPQKPAPRRRSRPSSAAGTTRRSGGSGRGQGSSRAGRSRSGKAAKPQAPAPSAERVVPRLRVRYLNEIAPQLRQEFGYTNPMQAPKPMKVIVNVGLGEALENSNALQATMNDIATITGQKAIATRARKSIAGFRRLRAGVPIGVKVTLRSVRMWQFLDRLINVALPRVRDFHGVPTNSFDGRGNYSLGLAEQIVFPEIDYNRIDRLRGLQITVVTTASSDEEARRLLELIGMPFKRPAQTLAASA